MKPGGIVGALAAAAIGAVAWALVAKFAGYEVGYVAWGVGALIGFSSALLGGKGMTNGVVCAFLALVAIASGKVLGSMWTTEEDIYLGYMDEFLAEEQYNVQLQEAAAFAKLTGKEQYPQFIVDNGCTGATTLEEVTEDDLAEFKDHAESLRKLAAENPTYEAWQDRIRPMAEEDSRGYAKEEAAQWTIGDHIVWSKDYLVAMDILFAVLGIASAFALGKGKEDEPAV